MPGLCALCENPLVVMLMTPKARWLIISYTSLVFDSHSLNSPLDSLLIIIITLQTSQAPKTGMQQPLPPRPAR